MPDDVGRRGDHLFGRFIAEHPRHRRIDVEQLAGCGVARKIPSIAFSKILRYLASASRAVSTNCRWASI